MAQRFAIDGNFTQSFVGGVSLNAVACPSNNPDDFASLFYDLDTGTVCYITASTDFCYEFFFDNERTVTLNRLTADHQANPPAQSFQFVGEPKNLQPLDDDVSDPVSNVNNAKFIMFDSSSANAGDLKNYLIQNTQSGSLKLSTTTQAVQINYTAQTVTGSKDNKIILGNSNAVPTGSNPQFTILTTTSNIPFTNGERVCVEILTSGGGGGTSTTYQTGSSVVQTELSNLLIKDFDSNVFVTSDPVTGQLTLQFGTPSEPTSLVGSLVGFNDNRFNKNTDTYNGKLTYDLNGTTFISASLIDVTGGGQIVKTSTDGDGNISFGSFSGTDPQATGSRTFKASLRVTLTDGTDQNFETSNFSGTLDKDPPGNPTITSVVSSNIQGGFNQSNGTSNTTFKVHIGATGSIVRDSGSGTLNSYEYDGGDGQSLSNATLANNGNLTLDYTGGTNQPSATLRNFFKSPSGENDPDVFFTSSRIVSSDRQFVYKFGAAATASLLEGDVLDLTYLKNLGFQSSSTQFDEDPQSNSFTIQGASFDFHYLIVKDNVATSTPTITVNNSPVTFPEVAHYPSIEGGVGYRVFRTGQQGSAAVTYTYTAD
jgi:hypothetical protein